MSNSTMEGIPQAAARPETEARRARLSTLAKAPAGRLLALLVGMARGARNARP